MKIEEHLKPQLYLTPHGVEKLPFSTSGAKDPVNLSADADHYTKVFFTGTTAVYCAKLDSLLSSSYHTILKTSYGYLLCLSWTVCFKIWIWVGEGREHYLEGAI